MGRGVRGSRRSGKSTQGGEVKVGEDVLLLAAQDVGRARQGEHRLQVGELLVKVAHVLRGLDDRDEWGLHLLGQESVPVHPL